MGSHTLEHHPIPIPHTLSMNHHSHVSCAPCFESLLARTAANEQLLSLISEGQQHREGREYIHASICSIPRLPPPHLRETQPTPFGGQFEATILPPVHHAEVAQPTLFLGGAPRVPPLGRQACQKESTTHHPHSSQLHHRGVTYNIRLITFSQKC